MAIEINGTTGISGVNGSATTPALQGQDTNTGISFGTDEVNVVTGGETQAKVDNSGRLLVGRTTAPVGTLCIAGRSDGANNSPFMRLDIANATPANNAGLGVLAFGTTSDTGENRGANITALRDGGTWTANSSLPTRLGFYTTADGSATPTERFRIGSAGQLGIGANYGTSGQVLTSQGASAAPQWATPAEGLVDYGGTFVSGTSTLNVTNISLDCRLLKIYVMHVSCLFGAGPQISLRVGNGSVSSQSYTGRVFEANSNTQQSTGSNQVNITHTGHTAASHIWTGIIDVGMSVSSGCTFSWNIFTEVNHCEFGAARWNGNNRIDRIQLFSPSGNWDGGYIRIFGDR